MGMDKEERLLSAEDVARILCTTSEVVISLTWKGELRGRRMGRYWRYSYEDLKLYFQNQMQNE